MRSCTDQSLMIFWISWEKQEAQKAPLFVVQVTVGGLHQISENRDDMFSAYFRLKAI